MKFACSPSVYNCFPPTALKHGNFGLSNQVLLEIVIVNDYVTTHGPVMHYWTVRGISSLSICNSKNHQTEQDKTQLPYYCFSVMFPKSFFFLCLSLRLFLSLLPPSAEQQRNDCWVTVSTNSLWVRESPRILAQSFLTIHSSQLPPSLTSRLSGRTSADVLRHFFRPPGHSVPCTLFLPFFFFTSCYYCTYWIVSGASLHSLHLGFCLDW